MLYIREKGETKRILQTDNDSRCLSFYERGLRLILHIQRVS